MKFLLPLFFAISSVAVADHYDYPWPGGPLPPSVAECERAQKTHLPNLNEVQMTLNLAPRAGDSVKAYIVIYFCNSFNSCTYDVTDRLVWGEAGVNYPFKYSSRSLGCMIAEMGPIDYVKVELKQVKKFGINPVLAQAKAKTFGFSAPMSLELNHNGIKVGDFAVVPK
jgi:hypothetical protein